MHSTVRRRHLRGNMAGVVMASWSADGTRIVTACIDGTASVWLRSPNGQWRVEARTPCADDSVRGHVAMSTGGVTGAVFEPPLDAIAHIAQSSTPLRILTSGDDGYAFVWRVHSGAASIEATIEHRAPGAASRARIRRAVFSTRGQRIVTAGFDSTARVWARGADSAFAQQICVVRHTSLVWSAEFAPGDATTLLTASHNSVAALWRVGEAAAVGGPATETSAEEVGDAELVGELSGHLGPVTCARFSPLYSAAVGSDPRAGLVATASYDTTVALWSAHTQMRVATFTGHRSRVWSVEFGRSEQPFLVSASDDGEVRCVPVPRVALRNSRRASASLVRSPFFSAPHSLTRLHFRRLGT